MHPYRECIQERNYATVDYILKIMNFKIFSHFALFLLIWYICQRYQFYNWLTHTQIQIHTNECTYRCIHVCLDAHSDTDTIFTFCSFWLIWHTCQRYKFYIWYTTDIHRHRYTHMHTHIQVHTDTHIHTYRHT